MTSFDGSRGHHFIFLCRSWLYPVFTTPDAELMRTAGLDSLMLCWTCTLGIQVLSPLWHAGNDYASNEDGFKRRGCFSCDALMMLIQKFHAVYLSAGHKGTGYAATSGHVASEKMVWLHWAGKVNHRRLI